MCYSLQEIKDRVVPIARDFGVERLSLFGSYARNEARDDSDVDILIREGRLKGVYQYMAFVYALEDALRCHVDVVMDGVRDEAFLRDVKRDEVVLYEAG